ncbi:MAG: S1-like domain-containing RNA-binding protein [Bacteroidota bacterium]
MIEIGKYNTLQVDKLVDFGLYLTDGESAILLPKKWVLRDMLPGKEVKVFVYKDNEERPIATTMTPYAEVGQFAFLKVKEINDFGAFLDWGIEKDIFVPFREQGIDMQVGRSYTVFLYIDSITERVTASAKLQKFLSKEEYDFIEHDAVDILVAKKTDLGYEAIINNQFKGLLYDNEIFEPIRVGETRRAYVKKIRPDGKIDLNLQGKGFGISADARDILLEKLRANNGFLALHDGSDPEQIQAVMNMSKKAFKKAVGGLYKDKLIEITDKGIQLL